MVRGLRRFAAAFEGLEDQYVLIGGAAAELWFQRAGMEFRATNDLDLVLCVEALGSEFVRRFWAFIEDGGYAVKERAGGTPIKYRFDKPTRSDFPKLLELFASAPLGPPAHRGVVPIAVDEEVSSLSALLLDPAYREVVLRCREVVEGLTSLTPEGLVLLKARAWLDLTARKLAGDTVDSKHIRKHRNDVFRIAALLGEHPVASLQASVLADLDQFLRAIETRPEEWPAIEAACGSSPLTDPEGLLEVLRSQFELAKHG